MFTISGSEEDFREQFPEGSPTATENDAYYQTRFQCRHIFTQCRRCGSACLRGEHFCYHHHTTRVPVYSARQRSSRQSIALTSGQSAPDQVPMDLPMPEDRDAIRLAAGQILHAIASNSIDARRAGMMLYALQIANCSLPRQTAKSLSENTTEDLPVDTVTHHPDLGVIAPQTEFEEPKEPEEKPSFARRLLENMQQHEQIMLGRKRIAELEARLSGYEPVTATVDLDASHTSRQSEGPQRPSAHPPAEKQNGEPKGSPSQSLNSLDVARQRSPDRRKRRPDPSAQRLHGRHRSQPDQRRHQSILNQILPRLVAQKATQNSPGSRKTLSEIDPTSQTHIRHRRLNLTGMNAFPSSG